MRKDFSKEKVNVNVCKTSLEDVAAGHPRLWRGLGESQRLREDGSPAHSHSKPAPDAVTQHSLLQQCASSSHSLIGHYDCSARGHSDTFCHQLYSLIHPTITFVGRSTTFSV